MPNHFSTIGMLVDSEEQMSELAQKASENSAEISCRDGHYLKWSSDDGAELWLQIDKNNNLVGLTPSFSGESVMRVGITNHVQRPDDTAFEGAIHGWANPPEEDLELGEYPFVFDLVDKAIYGELDFPFYSEVILSAFAHEISVYATEDEYDSQQTEEPKFASESFIPSGLFNSNDEEESYSEPFAIFTGKVVDYKKLNNPLTGGEYHWALVKTLGGTIDVVCDPVLVKGAIVKHGIISGSFWLNGKIKDPKIKSKQGLIRGLFGKKI